MGELKKNRILIDLSDEAINRLSKIAIDLKMKRKNFIEDLLENYEKK